MLTSAHLSLPCSFCQVLFSVLISQHLRSSSFCQVLFLYLLICGFKKQLVRSRSYIFRSRSCFLSSFPSSFLTQQPIYSMGLLTCLPLALSLYRLVSYLSSLCLLINYTTLSSLPLAYVTLGSTVSSMAIEP